MLDKMKDMGKLLKDAQEMKKKMKAVQDELKKAVVYGKSRNVLVMVTMTGELDVTKVDIDPSLMIVDKADVLKKSVLEAINDASAKAKKLATGRLSDISKGMNLPGMQCMGQPLVKLIESFKLLPGIGQKSAERLAFYVLFVA